MVSSKKVSIFGFAIVLLGPPKVTFIKPFSPSLIFLGLLYYGEDRGRRIFTSKLRDFFLPRTMSNVSWKVLPTVRDRPPFFEELSFLSPHALCQLSRCYTSYNVYFSAIKCILGIDSEVNNESFSSL